MRYGIMAMQIDSLVPAGLPAEQILAHIARFDQAALVRGLASHGFNPIELGGDLAMLLPQTITPPAIEHLSALKAELGLSYTVHLPLWSVEPSTLQTPVREGSIRALTDCIRTMQPLAPEVFVLHATGALAAEFYRMRLPEMARLLLLRQFQSAARQSIQAILAGTGLPSRQLAIETIEFPFELTLELAEQLDLSMCLDTGHVLAGFSGPVELFSVLARILPRLAEIHLHDSLRGTQEAPGYGQDHRPLGTGDLDVPRLLHQLEEAHFNGPIIFELRTSEALQSLQYISSL